MLACCVTGDSSQRKLFWRKKNSVLEKDFHLKTDDCMFGVLTCGVWVSRSGLPCAWGRRTFHPEWCKSCWNNQGRSRVHVWPVLCPTAHIKTADVNADGLDLQWKKCVGLLRDGERASSTGSRVIKTHEAKRPWATRGKPLLFRPVFQSDLRARIKQYYSAAS